MPYPYYPTLVGLARGRRRADRHHPGGADTKHLINAEVLRALGPNGILINVARGSVVDEEALIEALRSKTILTAGLDVFADEPRVPQALIDMDHIVLVPHVGLGVGPYPHRDGPARPRQPGLVVRRQRSADARA